MLPASTNGGGMTVLPGPLDACKTPSPAGPVPLPYPNMGTLTQAGGGTCSAKVKIENKKACTKKTEITMSSGDEGGVAGGGIVSSRIKGTISFMMGSSVVSIEGEDAVHLTSMTGHNGNNANVPGGAQVAPSQTTVTLRP